MSNKNFFILLGIFIALGITSCTESSQNDTSSDESSIYSESASDSFEDKLSQYEREDRVFWQKPDLVIDKLGDLSDKVVADIGAGSGYFSTRLAPRSKSIIAIDIDQKFVDYIDSLKTTLPTSIQSKIQTRLTDPSKSGLKNEEADVAIMVNTYMYIRNRVNYLEKLNEALSSKGRVLIVDFKKKRIPVDQPGAKARIPLYIVENELIKAGFKIIDSDDRSLAYQYIILAEK